MGFDLSEDYTSNPEVILRKTRARLKKTPVVETLGDSQAKRSLASEFEAMADKTLINSLPQQLPTFIQDQRSMLERMDSSSSLRSLPWCKLANSVERLMKMQVHTYNTFWRFASPSHSREYPEMLHYSAFSHFYYWGKQNSGSMLIKIRILPRTNVQLLF
jgi:hypothetical protein